MGLTSEFKVKVNNIDKIKAQLHGRIPLILDALGLEGEGNAITEANKLVYDTPERGYVRTGALKNSITHDKDNQYAYIGSNLDYAPYVELGTYKMKARPFLRNAVTKGEYRKAYEKIVKDGMS